MRLLCAEQTPSGLYQAKVYRNREWDEFVVKPCFRGKNATECSWYFTSDKQDAIDTAKAMCVAALTGERK
jgi:hypothetical protein